MALSVLGLAAGLLLLTYAADQFVIGAARLAVRLQLSTVVVGAVVIGFGTSAPEMVVSGLAAGQGSLDIAVGNIIGSNVANLSLVLGTAAMVIPIAARSPTMRREAPISLAAVVVFGLLVQSGLTRVEGLVLGIGLVVALGWVLYSSRGEDPEISDEVEEFVSDPAALSMGRESVRTLLGLVGTLVAAQVLVTSATALADRIGLGEGFVGLTIVAIGTSLPELATSLQAARKAETDLIIGNLLGSNIFNSLAVGAVAALAGPGSVQDPNLTGTAVVLMIGVALAATVFMATGRQVVRGEGAALLIAWLVALPLLA